MNSALINACMQHDSFIQIMHETNLSMKQLEHEMITIIRKLITDNNGAIEIDYQEPSLSSILSLEDSSDDSDGCSTVRSYTELDSIDPNMSSLSEEQKNFISLAMKGNSLFLTAPAGYGKSFAIDHVIKELRLLHDSPDEPSRVAITASTGKAAEIINGRTLHSYLGIGLARLPVEKLYEKVKTVFRLRPKYKELKNVATIIIDEVSMINDELLTKISKYLSLIKQNTEPFGGIQMIFVGDLHQLPPVQGRFFIDSSSYKALNPAVIQFTKCFRQDNIEFQQILSEARVGKLSRESYDRLKLCNDIDRNLFGDDVKPMKVCSTNREVDAINQKELNKIEGDIKVYPIIPISLDEKKVELSAKAESIPSEVVLKVGAQIVVTFNVSMNGKQSIANGSQGLVVAMNEKSIDMMEVGSNKIVKVPYQKLIDPDCIDEDDNPEYVLEYLPVRLGWALTIHKCQGMTTSIMEVDLSKVFADGQAYVAVSRVRSIDGLKIIGLKETSFIANQKILQFYQRI
jgi:ATP-dependent exoDNAse (exonuclease V) alpha subunit